MIVLKIHKVKDQKVLNALLSILLQFRTMKANLEKPRFSGIYEIKIEGQDEQTTAKDIAVFAAQVGWEIE